MKRLHRRLQASRPKGRQVGVSMIELLVAFVIFSFGMLGVAGLQIKTLAYNQSSLLRSQAAALTDDVMDRLRLDKGNALSGHWNTTLETPGDSVTTSGIGIVTTDLADWKLEIERVLPDGRASIEVNNATQFVTVEIRWDDSRGKEDPQTFRTISRL